MKSRSVPSNAEALNQIVYSTQQALASTQARLLRLHEQAKQSAELADRERVELQRFLEEFGLEPAVLHHAEDIGEHELVPLFDIEAMRTGVLELDMDVVRSTALRSNLDAVVQMVQMCSDHMTADQAYAAVQDTADLRLQQAMSAAREDERRRLAREIHDGPAQVLTNAIYAIQITEQVAKRSPDQVAEELSRVRQLLKDGVAEIRRFMFDLRPTMLQDQGLEPTLRRYVDDHSRFFAKRVDLDMPEAIVLLSSEQELTIFRIVQEALQNVHRHAGPDADAWIAITQQNGLLTMTISDNGRGFNPEHVVSRPDSGAGLPGMRERAKLAAAELTVTSASAQGTIVELKMRMRGYTGDLAQAVR